MGPLSKGRSWMLERGRKDELALLRVALEKSVRSRRRAPPAWATGVTGSGSFVAGSDRALLGRIVLCWVGSFVAG
jgi:hypothetical protein